MEGVTYFLKNIYSYFKTLGDHINYHDILQVPPALNYLDQQGRSLNKQNIHISESSPPEVSEAYLRQFQEDFSLFLKSRSEELINGGKMVLILLGRMGKNHVDRGNSFFWELLSKSLAILVSKVLVYLHN